jgi:hypothetical protein
LEASLTDVLGRAGDDARKRGLGRRPIAGTGVAGIATSPFRNQNFTKSGTSARNMIYRCYSAISIISLSMELSYFLYGNYFIYVSHLLVSSVRFIFITGFLLC